MEIELIGTISVPKFQYCWGGKALFLTYSKEWSLIHSRFLESEFTYGTLQTESQDWCCVLFQRLGYSDQILTRDLPGIWFFDNFSNHQLVYFQSFPKLVLCYSDDKQDFPVRTMCVPWSPNQSERNWMNAVSNPLFPAHYMLRVPSPEVCKILNHFQPPSAAFLMIRST